MRRAVHAGEYTDVVTRRHTAVGAANAVEAGRRVGIVRGARVDAITVVLGEIAHLAVLHMHVLARCDGTRSEPNDLAVATPRLTRRDWPHRNLVASGNAFGSDRAIRHLHAGQQRAARDHD